MNVVNNSVFCWTRVIAQNRHASTRLNLGFSPKAAILVCSSLEIGYSENSQWGKIMRYTKTAFDSSGFKFPTHVSNYLVTIYVNDCNRGKMFKLCGARSQKC